MSRRTGTLLIFVATLVWSVLLPYRTDQFWYDPISGSSRVQTQLFLIPVAHEVNTSDLERWIEQHEGTHKQSWKPVSMVSRSGMGTTTENNHAPELYRLRDHVDKFVRMSKDDEIADFLRTLRTGTRSEMRAAVEAALAKARTATKESVRDL